MKYLTLIYNYYNVLTRIEERDSILKAEKAGMHYTQRDGWYQVVLPRNQDEYDMWHALLNM